MIDHKASTEEIEAAISRAEALLEEWLWAAAHVQHYDNLIVKAENVPALEVPVSIAEWVAHQWKLDAARNLSSALWRLKKTHILEEDKAAGDLLELLPVGETFVIVAFNVRYHVETRRNWINVKLGDLP